MMKKWKERRANIMLGIFLGMVIILILLATICNHSKISYNHLQKVEPDSVDKLSDGGSVVELTLDESLKKRTTVAFFTSHQYVDVYVDGREVYSLKETAGRWGHTTGNVWNFVLLPVDTTHLTVKISPCYPETADASLTYYVGNGREIYTGIMRQSLPTFIISFIIMIVAIYMLVYWWLARKSGDIDATLLYLGLFAVLLGLWTANETDVAALLLVNRHASTFAAFILLMAMQIPFVLFVRSFLDLGDRQIWRMFCDLSMVMCVISCVLHFTGIWEFRQSLILTHIVIVGVLIYLAGAIIIKIVKKQVNRRLRRVCIGALILVILASIADLINYYKVGGNTGIWGRISFLIFIAILGVESASKTLSMLKRGRRAKELENAVKWLVDAGLIYQVYLVEKPEIPLSGEADYSSYKVYMADSGLLCRRSNVFYRTILDGDDRFIHYKGALSENYVLSQMKSLNINVWYWTSSANAEVDFLTDEGGLLYPVEVKAADNTKAKSLKLFCERYQPERAFRTSLRNVGMNQSGETQVWSIPLYSLFRLRKYLMTD